MISNPIIKCAMLYFHHGEFNCHDYNDVRYFSEGNILGLSKDSILYEDS